MEHPRHSFLNPKDTELLSEILSRVEITFEDVKTARAAYDEAIRQASDFFASHLGHALPLQGSAPEMLQRNVHEPTIWNKRLKGSVIDNDETTRALPAGRYVICAVIGNQIEIGRPNEYRRRRHGTYLNLLHPATEEDIQAAEAHEQQAD